MMRCKCFFMALLAAGILAAAGAFAQQTDKQKAELEWMLRVFPKSEAWEKWLKESGELPPDFDAMPRQAALPDPLLMDVNGKKVRATTPQQWQKQREQLLDLVKRYITGTVPPPPGNVRAAIRSEREETGAKVQDILLTFGPDHRASCSMELIIPKGKGPFPVFLTQDNHRGWALVAVSRGYVACVYAGADSKDDTAGFIPIWPDYDWTKLTRRAWASSRCIDYLETLPFVDKTKIAMTGHSRNGKQSLIAGALDERIAAVISSSSGAGGACSARYYGETQFGEGIELLTRAFPDWMHPRLRFFCGREDRLPVDYHDLIACIAPRSCLIATALNDNVESVWAIEHTYFAVSPLYDLLGAGGKLAIDWRPGTHETRAADIERYLDWFNAQFGRTRRELRTTFYCPRYQNLPRASIEKITPRDYPEKGIGDLLTDGKGSPIKTAEQWRARRGEIAKRIEWGLGEAPSVAVNPGGVYGRENDWRASMLGRGSVPSGFKKKSVNFANYITGDLYYPADAEKGDKKIPVVIWLHPISNACGYVAAYKRGEAPHLAILRQTGMAVFAFDQIGNGSRIEEVKDFYERYPRWSLLGKTVAEVRAAVDVLEKVPFVDSKRIYVLGYSVGAMAGLHATALDERIAGAVSVAGFTPMRLDTADKGTGGLARWTHAHVLQPRLGPFLGNEKRIPYDYHEVLALIAPRPLLVVTPQKDRENTLADVEACLAEVGKVYDLLGAKGQLRHLAPDDYNRYSPELQQIVNARLREIVRSE